MKTLHKKIEESWLILLMQREADILLPNERHEKTQNSKILASATQYTCLPQISESTFAEKGSQSFNMENYTYIFPPKIYQNVIF